MRTCISQSNTMQYAKLITRNKYRLYQNVKYNWHLKNLNWYACIMGLISTSEYVFVYHCHLTVTVWLIHLICSLCELIEPCVLCSHAGERSLTRRVTMCSDKLPHAFSFNGRFNGATLAMMSHTYSSECWGRIHSDKHWIWSLKQAVYKAAVWWKWFKLPNGKCRIRISKELFFIVYTYLHPIAHLSPWIFPYQTCTQRTTL